MLGLGTHGRGFCLQTLTSVESGVPLSEPRGRFEDKCVPCPQWPYTAGFTLPCWAARPSPCFVVPGTPSDYIGIKLVFSICTCVLHSVTEWLHKCCCGPQASLFPALLGFFPSLHGTIGVTNTEIRWTMEEMLHSSRLVAGEMKKKELLLSLVISCNTPMECINHQKPIQLRIIFIYCWQLECGWKEIVSEGKVKTGSLTEWDLRIVQLFLKRRGFLFFFFCQGLGGKRNTVRD